MNKVLMSTFMWRVEAANNPYFRGAGRRYVTRLVASCAAQLIANRSGGVMEVISPTGAVVATRSPQV